MIKTRNSPKGIRQVSLNSTCTVLGRRNGNTTRIIDKTIQDLFDGNICLVIDYHPNGFKDLWRKLLERLYREHRVVYDTYLYINEEEHIVWLGENQTP